MGSDDSDEEEVQEKIDFTVDTFYHQYYLRDPKKREEVYLLGGNFIHKINFKNRKWEIIDKGSDELLGR